MVTVEERVVSKGLEEQKLGGLERKPVEVNPLISHTYLLMSEIFSEQEWKLIQVEDTLKERRNATFISSTNVEEHRLYESTALVTAPELSVAQCGRIARDTRGFVLPDVEKWNSVVYDQRIGGNGSLDYSGDRGKQSKVDLVAFHRQGRQVTTIIGRLSYARMTSQSALL